MIRVTPAVRALLVANAAVFLVQTLAWVGGPEVDQGLVRLLGLVPARVGRGAVWQLATYLFLHGGLFHFLFNMLALYMFGPAVEERLGTREFGWLYGFCGVGAGVASVLFAWGSPVPLVGASGAILGVLMAFALLFPHRPMTLLVFFVLPVTMTARWLIAVFAGVEALILFSDRFGPGAMGQVAHLSGLAFGWIWLRFPGWLLRWRDRARARRADRQMRAVREQDARRERLQAEVDALLDKISRRGLAGLTEAERRRLYETSEELKTL